MEYNNLLGNSQNGFRKGRTTLDNLTILKNDIHFGFFNRTITTAIFIDIKGAYDNINIDILAHKLKEMKIRSKIINIINNISHSRTIFIQNKHLQIGHRRILKGIGQGTILAPLLT